MMIIRKLLFKERHKTLIPLLNIQMSKQRQIHEDKLRKKLNQNQVTPLEQSQKKSHSNLSDHDPNASASIDSEDLREVNMLEKVYSVDLAFEELNYGLHDSEMERLVDLFFQQNLPKEMFKEANCDQPKRHRSKSKAKKNTLEVTKMPGQEDPEDKDKGNPNGNNVSASLNKYIRKESACSGLDEIMNPVITNGQHTRKIKKKSTLGCHELPPELLNTNVNSPKVNGAVTKSDKMKMHSLNTFNKDCKNKLSIIKGLKGRRTEQNLDNDMAEMIDNERDANPLTKKNGYDKLSDKRNAISDNTKLKMMLDKEKLNTEADSNKAILKPKHSSNDDSGDSGENHDPDIDKKEEKDLEEEFEAEFEQVSLDEKDKV